MVQYSDYTDILFSTNFVGGAGKNDLSTISGESDQRANVTVDGSGYYQFYYYLLTNLTDLNALGYYTSGVDREYTQIPSGGPALTTNQSTILSGILTTSAWGTSFSDIAKIDFVSGTTSNADIVFGATTSGGTPNITDDTGGYEWDYSTGSSALKHGDVWLNNDFDAGYGSLWTDTSADGYGHFTIQHELAHALGLKHPSAGSVDNMQYTIMSTNLLAGMDRTGTANDVLPSGLQLLDIPALQEIYGINWSTRSGNTNYKQGRGFGATINTAFIYTIWDGAGTDTIDTSSYTNGVIIDLREGHFSSIGKAANSSYAGSRGTGLADDNVAIAYNAVIENAIGTAYADRLIGNEADNELQGKNGDDTYVYKYGGGFDTIIDTGGDDTLILKPGIHWSNMNSYSDGMGSLVLDIYSPGAALIGQITISDYFADSDNVVETIYFTEDDGLGGYELRGQNMTGTNGAETITGTDYDDYIRARGGDDTLIGGEGLDRLRGDDGNDTLWGGEGSDRLEGGNGADILYGESEWDNLFGGSGNDTLWGGSGYDALYGDADNDALHGESGDDELYGGMGDDTYYYSLGDGSDYIYDDGGENDRLIFDETIDIDNVLSMQGEADLVLAIYDSPSHEQLIDTITIMGHYVESANFIEEIIFQTV